MTWRICGHGTDKQWACTIEQTDTEEEFRWTRVVAPLCIRCNAAPEYAENKKSSSGSGDRWYPGHSVGRLASLSAP